MTAPLLFTPEMDWNDPLVEEREYETAIFVAYDDTETRQGLRPAPNRRLSYSVSAFDLRESGLLHALIHAGQGAVCWVPYWRGARYFGTDLAIGATSLALTNPRQAGFLDGEGAMFFRDWHTAEAVDVTSVSDGSIGFSATTQAWRGASTPRDRIVPLLRGRLAPEVNLDDVGRGMVQVPLTFDVGQGLGTEGTSTEPPDPGEPPAPCDTAGPLLEGFESYLTGSFDATTPTANPPSGGAASTDIHHDWGIQPPTYNTSGHLRLELLSGDTNSGSKAIGLTNFNHSWQGQYFGGNYAYRAIAGLVIGEVYDVRAALKLNWNPHDTAVQGAAGFGVITGSSGASIPLVRAAHVGAWATSGFSFTATATTGQFWFGYTYSNFDGYFNGILAPSFERVILLDDLGIFGPCA